MSIENTAQSTNTKQGEKMSGEKLQAKEVQQIYNAALTALYKLADESKLQVDRQAVQEAIKKEAKSIIDGICPTINRILEKRKEN
jgi:hypothetical protein